MRPALLLCCLWPAAAAAQICDGPARPLAPSRDLYCIELIAAPGIAASGRVELGRHAGPFTVDVTAAGQVRYTPTISLDGLPAPSAFGAYRVYVVWVAAQMMFPVTKLGVVTNGRATLPAITLDKFVILVTAETSPNAREPRGRIVLRGASPSTRLQPPDLIQFAVGATRDSPGDHAHHHMAEPQGDTDSAAWRGVPMPAGLTMLPAEMILRPRVAPYLPRPRASAPMAKPRELIRLGSVDTVRLTAGIVRRSFKGRTITMFGFNGQYPGPLLLVPQGANLTIELTNALDQPTTIHWHGVRLDNANDGVPDLTQPAVQPGQRFVYHVHFPDAGIYWYHPHVREDMQQDLGLYGNMLVRSPNGDYYSLAHREEILMVDDMLLDDSGLVPFGDSSATHALMGRFGNVLLVNGEPSYRLSVRRGEVVRFFLTNVSNTRTFNLSFGPGVRMKLVAADVGNFEREQWVESVVIAPAERYVVHVMFDRPGDVALVNRVQALDHVFGRFFYETDTMGVVHVAPERPRYNYTEDFDSLRTDTTAARDVQEFTTSLPQRHVVDKSLVLSVQTHDLPFFTRAMMQLDSIFFTPVEWSGTMPGMNWAATTDQVRWVVRDPETGKENMDVDWTFARGDALRLHILNERQSFHGMQHPIHIHGQRFLVLAVNGVPNTDRAWKDTVLIPVGATVDLLVDLSNPGRWMLHCHIAEHLSAQMMSVFTVSP